MESPRLTQLISRASRALSRTGDAALTPLGIRYAQAPVIVLLHRDEELTPKALAAAAGIEQPSMTELLSRMDRDGLIRRRPHPHDARSQLVALIPEQRARLDEARARLADLDRRAVAGLSEKEAILLRSLLLRVVNNLETEHEYDPDQTVQAG